MPQDPVRFGLIGCGEIALHSVKALQAAAESCRIAAVQDVMEPLAKELGERLGVPWSASAEELLQRPDVDAVVISTPHFLHEPLTKMAAKYGKHVACEKPIACTPAQADRMIAACRKAKVLLSINFVTRYEPRVLKAKELVEAGVIGKVLRFQANVMADKPESYWSGGYTGRARSDWRQSKSKAGGGVLIMNLSHDIDRIHWLAKLEPVRVFAEADTHATPVEVEDNISVVARYRNGALGSLDAMSCARGKESFGNRLYGTHGQIVMDKVLRVFTIRDSVPGIPQGVWTEVDPPVDSSPAAESRARYFADLATAIRQKSKRCLISGEEARKSLAFISAAYQSAQTGKPVRLSAVRKK